MKPIEFKDQTTVFAENQPEYGNLPALKIDSSQGEVISCWKMTLTERIKVLFTGKVWLNLMSFNKPLTPSFMSVNRKDIYSRPDDKDFKSIVDKNVKLLKDLRDKKIKC